MKSSCSMRTACCFQTFARHWTTTTCLVIALHLQGTPLAGAWTSDSTKYWMQQIHHRSSSSEGFGYYSRSRLVNRSPSLVQLLHTKLSEDDGGPMQGPRPEKSISPARNFAQNLRKIPSKMIGHYTLELPLLFDEIFAKRGIVFAPLIVSALICILAPADVLAFTSITPSQQSKENSFVVSSDVPISPGRMTSSILTDHTTLLLASNPGTETRDEVPTTISPLDEVWTLVDKYYVNKASNTNWKGIRQDYVARFQKSSGIEEQMKVVSDMVSTLGDKYSRILTPSQYADIQKFDLLGVGVTLMPQEGRIVVGAPPLPGSASDKAGLQLGDQVIQVNGVTTVGKTALDIIDQVSEHPEARTLTLTIVPLAHIGEEDAIERYGYDVTLDRTLMTVQNPIRYKMNEDKIGYIRVAEFNSLVLTKLEDALKAMPDAKGYVLDLRHNTGGAFQSAIEISSLFLSDKVATFVVDNTDQKVPFRTTKEQSLAIKPDIPLVIWIDGRSASASEVLASALHDNCRAVLTGSNSFGKGLIQAVYGLRNGGGLVLTVARYVTPAGNDIQGAGIVPDIPGKVPLSIMGIPVSSDTSSIDWEDVQQRLAQCKVPSY